MSVSVRFPIYLYLFLQSNNHISMVDGCFTRDTLFIYNISRFCTTLSVYVSFSKNSFRCSLSVFRRKRMQRYGLFHYPANIFQIIFNKTSIFFTIIDKHQGETGETTNKTWLLKQKKQINKVRTETTKGSLSLHVHLYIRAIHTINKKNYVRGTICHIPS